MKIYWNSPTFVISVLSVDASCYNSREEQLQQRLQILNNSLTGPLEKNKTKKLFMPPCYRILVLYSARPPPQISGSFIISFQNDSYTDRNILETQVQSLGWKDPLEKGMATHANILAWRIPWTEAPRGLLSIGLQSQT